MPGVPDLSQIVGAEQPTTEPEKPVESASQSPSEKTAADQKRLRDLLVGKGFDVPEDMTEDDQIVDAIGAAIDQTNSILSDERYTKYVEQKDSFEEWLKQKQQEQAKKPETPKVEPAQKSSATISSEAQALMEGGYITRNKETGQWTASNSAFQSAADEYNRADAVKRANILKFSQDPEGFIKQIATSLSGGETEKKIQALESLVNELKTQLTEREKREAESARTSSIQKWVSENSNKLFENGDRSKLTEYGKLYQEAEKKVRGAGAKDPEVVHRAVVSILDMIKVPAKTAEKKQPFLNGDRKQSNSKLTEFAGESPAKVSVPKGKAGLPSLAAIIAESESLTTE